MRVRAALALLAAILPAGAGAAVLEQVEVSTDPALVVRLTLSEPAAPAGHSLPAEGATPPRFYVDLADTTLGPGAGPTVDGVGSVLRIRLGQFDRSTTRVVLDLASALPFTVRSVGRTVTIEAGAVAAGPHPPAAPPVRVASLPPPTESAPLPVPAPPPPTVTPTAPSLRAEAPKAPPSSPPPTIAKALPPPPLPPVGPSSVASLPPPAPPPATTATVTPILPSLRTETPRAPTPSPPPTIAMALPEPPAPPGRPVPAPNSAPVTKPSVARVPNFTTPPVIRHGTLVVVDAGHGGRDPGAAGIGGIVEKDIVLEFARLLAAKLSERLPVDTLLTRGDDSFVPLNDRLPPPDSHAALFLSLHANACSDPQLGGVEVFYGGGQLRRAATGTSASPEAAILARFLAAALRAQVGAVRDPRPGPFTVLTHNPAPSALIEIGYLTHAGDAARAQDAAYREALTDAVVIGVDTFLRATAPQL